MKEALEHLKSIEGDMQDVELAIDNFTLYGRGAGFDDRIKQYDLFKKWDALRIRKETIEELLHTIKNNESHEKI